MHLVSAPAKTERLLDIGRGELVDDGELALLAPEVGEPTTHNGFVVALF